MEEDTISEIATRFSFLMNRPSGDHAAFNCPAGQLIEVATALRDDFGFDLLVDVTGIDWDAASPRFTGVYHFLSSRQHVYLRLAVDCLDDINPELPSLAAIYPAADWHERETFDMLGIRYAGHPNMKRILMWDDYPYYPLRKEFPLAGIETDLPAPDVVETTHAKVKSAPMMGGPFVSIRPGPMSEAEPRARDESWTESDEKPVEKAAAKAD